MSVNSLLALSPLPALSSLRLPFASMLLSSFLHFPCFRPPQVFCFCILVSSLHFSPYRCLPRSVFPFYYIHPLLTSSFAGVSYLHFSPNSIPSLYQCFCGLLQFLVRVYLSSSLMFDFYFTYIGSSFPVSALFPSSTSVLTSFSLCLNFSLPVFSSSVGRLFPRLPLFVVLLC